PRVSGGNGPTQGSTAMPAHPGVLYRSVPSKSGGTKLQLVLPEKYIHEFLHYYHDSPFGGHLGKLKTLLRLLEVAWWPSVRRDVWDYVKRCEVCQKYKTPSGKPAGELQTMIPSEPGEMLGVDLMGPLPSSTTKKTILMVVVDYFSKWVELFALPDAKTHRICTLLKNEIFTRWGVPKFIVSDRGPQFTSEIMERLYLAWGVKRKLTTAYHLQSNLTERVNRTLKTMVASYVGDRHQDWDKWLPELRFAINTVEHEALGETPALVTLGRQIKGPLDRLVESIPLPDTSQYRTLETLEELRKKVQARLVRSTSRQAKYYNARHRKVHYEGGDLVWVRTHYLSDAARKFSSKLAPKWVGPAIILKQLGPNNYRVQKGTNSESKIDTKRPGSGVLQVRPAKGRLCFLLPGFRAFYIFGLRETKRIKEQFFLIIYFSFSFVCVKPGVSIRGAREGVWGRGSLRSTQAPVKFM
uniref:Gypsy retrotransposon integrase-like protein 1 n=1 Tax=Erpetoichthys calabaricus TaxID=27687 RepID=A0A8C4S7S2_ERPCA